MSKKLPKRFLLVSIDEDMEPTQTIRKLRRYLSSHKLSYIFSSTLEEMKDYLDKLQSNTSNFQEIADQQNTNDRAVKWNQPLITLSSNQEILEQWAREAFSENSDAMKLLFGLPVIDQEEPMEQFDNQKPEDNTIDHTQLFTTHSIDLENMNDSTAFENGKEEAQDLIYCSLCKDTVEVGRNRNTRIRRQAQHVIDSHSKDEFIGVEIAKRYQCLGCERMLPVSKSPCEHISDYHGKTDTETEFRDLWTKEQLSLFNSVMEQCFDRHLPVPRSRRIKSETTRILEAKASYRIVKEDEIVQINTVAEKTRHASDRAVKDGKVVLEESKPSSSMEYPEALQLSDNSDDSYYQMNDIDSDDGVTRSSRNHKDDISEYVDEHI